MVYQVPRTYQDLQQNAPAYHTGLHQLQNVLLFSKAKNDGKFISISAKNQRCKKVVVVKAKVLLPVRIPVLDSIYTLVKLRKDGLEFLGRLSEQYGSLFELPFGPITLTFVSDPAIIQKLLSSAQLAYLNKPKIYNSLFGEVFHNGLLTSESEIWSAQRKMLARSFTYKSLQNFLVFMNTHTANLTEKLIHECENNNASEVQSIHQFLGPHAFKIISQIVMGTDSIPPDESNEVAEYFDRSKDLVQDRLLNPWKYLWLLPKRREISHAVKYLNDFFVKITQKYKEEYKQTTVSSSSQKSTLSETEHATQDQGVGEKPFRCMIEEMFCSGASDEEIYEQLGTILGAGHDTTTIAIKMVMLQLAVNPDHQATCRGEVDKVINKKGNKQTICNHINGIGSFELNMEDLPDLKYLERCILESGRITSIVPVFLRRIDAPLKIDDDLEFPAGTNFAIFNWILHRDPQIYPDPLKFDPDRFLSENVKKRHPYSYTAFSMGPRNCIGSKVAIMEIKVMLAYILHHFEIFSDDKLENVKMYSGITLVLERDYRIVLKRREQPNL